MAFPIESKLVLAVASSALFDPSEADEVFNQQGPASYRTYQRAHESDCLAPGVAFRFIQRLLHLSTAVLEGSPVEVVLLSRNDPDTGLRVFRSIEHHRLPISRAAFVNGRDPFRYMESFNASLFLSGNPRDVHAAIAAGLPAGLIMDAGAVVDTDDTDAELRIAFDFDGVLADDSAEKVYRSGQLVQFHRMESEHRAESLGAGPLHRFFLEVSRIQQRELAKQEEDPSYKPLLRTALVTARNAPAHERVVTTLRHWGVHVDEAFFLGGIDKARVLGEFRPHIFFDDQLSHLTSAASVAPCVHVPFGVANELLSTVNDTHAGNHG